jgi:hypothetical protein
MEKKRKGKNKSHVSATGHPSAATISSVPGFGVGFSTSAPQSVSKKGQGQPLRSFLPEQLFAIPEYESDTAYNIAKTKTKTEQIWGGTYRTRRGQTRLSRSFPPDLV